MRNRKDHICRARVHARIAMKLAGLSIIGGLDDSTVCLGDGLFNCLQEDFLRGDGRAVIFGTPVVRQPYLEGNEMVVVRNQGAPTL